MLYTIIKVDDLELKSKHEIIYTTSTLSSFEWLKSTLYLKN